MNVVLHIERLILDGVALAPAEHDALRTALAGELSQLLAGGIHPALHSSGALAAIAGGSVEVARGASGTQIGNQIAQAVHQGIGVQNVSRTAG